MAEITAPANIDNQADDPRFLQGQIAGMYGGMSPGVGWSSHPGLTSSDILARRVRDGFTVDARDAARSNPYGKSALRTQVDAVIGEKLTLNLEPQADVLGVSDEEASDWAETVEAIWESTARSIFCPMDAQRVQSFTGLMRTAYGCSVVDGEALGVIQWKMAHNGQRTCLSLVDPERLSDPRGVQDLSKDRRMGVERDKHGAPKGYHIRTRHSSDAMAFGPPDPYTWKYVPRYTYWGRQNVLHYLERDRPDMTRGFSTMTTALLPMRLLNDYMVTELESAAIRSTYAAVIQSKLDYDDAMKVIGEEYASTVKKNPILDFTLRMMADRAGYYRGQEFRFGKSKVAHLLPDEELKVVQGNTHLSSVKDFTATNLYTLASALGVDYASLTKDYSSTNYSGARAALYDVWRSYVVRRDSFMHGFAWPFFVAWLEEMVALRGIIPMLGNKNFYEVIDALAYGSFETWTKPRLDPMKETQADLLLYKAGGLSLRDLAQVEGKDWRKIMRQRAREKAEMEALGLEPQDIDWDLIMNAGKDNQPGEGTDSEGGSSTGSSSNG